MTPPVTRPSDRQKWPTSTIRMVAASNMAKSISRKCGCTAIGETSAVMPPDISITDIYRSVIPFVGVMILMLAIMMLFPELALWLPDRVYNK